MMCLSILQGESSSSLQLKARCRPLVAIEKPVLPYYQMYRIFRTTSVKWTDTYCMTANANLDRYMAVACDAMLFVLGINKVMYNEITFPVIENQ